MRILVLAAMLFGVYGFSQDLSREEVLEGRVIGLEQGQLVERRASLIKEIQPVLDQIKALESAIADYNKKLAAKEAAILKERKLDDGRYVINWKESKIEEKPKEPAAK